MPYSSDLDVRLTDTSLRDGSHAKRHKFSRDDVARISSALDAAGIPVIEVTHGDGLGGSSFTFGFSATDERLLIQTAVAAVDRAKVAVLILPGVGVYDDIKAAADLGVSICRVATHCTEADVSPQHFAIAREVGLETVGFLMMAHTQPPERLAKEARIMVDAGCQCVYVVDSAGALVLGQVTERVQALVAEIGGEAQVGFHGHENLGLGVGNSIVAAQAGAVQIDGSTRRFGAGAGNTPLEAFVAAVEKIDMRTGVDVLALIDAAEDVVRPVMDDECVLDRLALVMGYAGVYSSFLKHAYRVSERYGVAGSEILLEAGRRGLVGGQEDQLIDIAVELSHQLEQAAV
jgi:4-hydroxy 2-oxovalerate aldolase